MAFRKFALFAAALALAATLAAATEIQPAVQPGGDIPPNFPAAAPPPRAGDIPPAFNPPRGDFHYVRREAMIPMRDGAKLYAVLIVPKGATRAPILLDRTPYSADNATSRNGQLGPWPENVLSPAYAELVRAGYIVAIEDVRGKYKSEGDYVMNRPLRGPLNPTQVDHSTDAFDTIEWLIRNVPEASGRVATIGTSYNGFTALMSLVDPHPALKASVPINPMVDVWKGDDWFHNGAFRQEMISYVYGQTASKKSDEDWFATGHDTYNTFLRYGSAGAYGRAMGMEQLPFWVRLTRHPAYDEFWQHQAVDRILARKPLAVPTLIVDSLWDQEDIYGAPAAFAAVKASPNAFLVLGPWHHGQANSSAASLGPLDFGGDTGKWFRANVLIPFLNQHLKDGPAANIAKVTAFEAGTNQWRRLDRLAGVVQDRLPGEPDAAVPRAGPAAELHRARRPGVRFLRLRSGQAGHLPRPAQPFAVGAGLDLALLAGRRPALRRRPARRARLCLRAAEAEPLRLAGTPLVHLVASTSGSDSDWVVKLIDVYPDQVPDKPALGGYQLAIAMDVIRGRYRTDPARPQPLTPNAPLTYEFALPAVNYTLASPATG